MSYVSLRKLMRCVRRPCICVHYLVMGRTRPRGKLIEDKEWHGRGGESERERKKREVSMITHKHINHKLCMAYVVHFLRGSYVTRHVICTIYTQHLLMTTNHTINNSIALSRKKAFLTEV